MNLSKQIRRNQHDIEQLSRSLGLLLNTPNAAKPEVRAKVIELQNRTMFRIQELEIEGQKVKLESMQKVVGLLRGEIEPKDV